MKRLLLTSLLFSFVCCMNIQAQNNFGNNRNNRNTYNNGRDAYGNQIDPNMQPDSFTNDSTEIESAPPKLNGAASSQYELYALLPSALKSLP